MQNQPNLTEESAIQLDNAELRVKMIAEKIDRITQFPLVQILPVIDTTYLQRLIRNYIQIEQPYELVGHLDQVVSTCMSSIESKLPHLIQHTRKQNQDSCYSENECTFCVTPNFEEYQQIHNLVKGAVVQYLVGVENMDWYQSQLKSKLTPR